MYTYAHTLKPIRDKISVYISQKQKTKIESTTGAHILIRHVPSRLPSGHISAKRDKGVLRF